MIRKARFASLVALVLVGCTAAQSMPQAAPSTTADQPLPARFDFGQPYLAGPLPNGARLIHPLPQDGDARMVADREANARALSLRGSPRWELAAHDANLGSGWYSDAYACTAGTELTRDAAPAIANVVRRAASDFGVSTREVKQLYMRARPFVANGEASCTPEEEAFLRTNGSYPSGHSAIGYGTALVLASIFPERAAELIARGRSYGNSRWICNVHWLSDVEEGRAFAAATFARLQASPEFRADLAAAQEEAKAIAGRAPPDAGKCAAEAAALGD